MALDERQLEERIQAGEAEVGDLEPADRDRVVELRAVRSRLKSAFASVEGGPALEEQIRHALRHAAASPPPAIGVGLTAAPDDARTPAPGAAAPTHFRFPTVPRWLLAAAAMVVLAVVLPMLWPTTPTAQAQLASIHQANLAGKTDHLTEPNAIAANIRNALGFTPLMPRLGQGEKLDGCCVSEFRKKKAASYLLRLPEGAVSIVVTNVSTKQLESDLRKRIERRGRAFLACGHDGCKLVALQIGDQMYFAVGERPHEELVRVLMSLLPPEE